MKEEAPTMALLVVCQKHESLTQVLFFYKSPSDQCLKGNTPYR